MKIRKYNEARVTSRGLIKYTCALLITLVVGSCNDILDKVPKESLNEAIVWSDPDAASLFVYGIYGAIPSGFDRLYDGWAKGLYILDAGSDDADCAIGWTSSERLNNGNFLPSQVPYGDIWRIYYKLVRSANLALENLDRLENETMRNQLKAETHFLRAYIYHDLLRFYGMKSAGTEPTGVPIIDRVLTPDDDPTLVRNTYDEVVAFIIQDLDLAIQGLPTNADMPAGRATLGAAYALKGRVLLYDEQWEESAAASLKVINGEAGTYSLFNDYRTLFLTKNNSEILWAKKFQLPDKSHQTDAGGTAGAGWDVYNSPRSFAGPNDAGWVGNCPTQAFVESYEMTDGLPQATSPLFDPQNPFDNVDPRFDATVVHDGSTFRGEVMEMYFGGRHDLPGANSTTGYYTRKFHRENVPVYSLAGDQDWIFIRYAEVLLNYAEAQNELNGPDASVYDAINQIRSRESVGMPDLPAGLSQSEMRTRIRNERRVELAFEEHRFYDIRRWRIAEQLLNGPMYGIQMTKSPSTQEVTYSKFVFENRSFPEKLYVMPVPQGEIDSSPGLTQINGW